MESQTAMGDGWKRGGGREGGRKGEVKGPGLTGTCDKRGNLASLQNRVVKSNMEVVKGEPLCVCFCFRSDIIMSFVQFNLFTSLFQHIFQPRGRSL